MEKFLHAYLSEFRSSGEWFSVEPEIIDSVLAMHNSTLEGNGVFTVIEDGSGWKIALNRWMKTEDDHVVITPGCITVNELEYECLQIIRSAMGIIAKARQHKANGYVSLAAPRVQICE